MALFHPGAWRRVSLLRTSGAEGRPDGSDGCKLEVTLEISVKSQMTGDPVAIDADASAAEALELLVDHGIRHLPVVDGDRRVIGVLSLDDLRAALPIPVVPGSPPSPTDREAARDWRVGEIMTHAPETATAETSLQEAAERMAERRIGCLPVVDEEGRLEGILSETDVLHALATSLWSDQVRERRSGLAELEALVSELRRERERITRKLDRLHQHEREVTTTLGSQPTDRAEQAAEVSEVQLTEGLDVLAARRLEAIDRALDHAAQGRLGICDSCRGRIPLTRLQAMPGTTICVACARAAEG